MINNINDLTTLKSSLNDLIFDIGRGLDHRTLHDKTLTILLHVNEIEQLSKKPHNLDKNETEEEQKNNEILKVERKLKLWAKKKEQVNARILNHFLTLQNEGNNQITQSDLEIFARKEGIINFYGNFHGMREISPKNHAKVFDVNNGIVSIWEPVKLFVEEYKNKTRS